MNWLWNCKPNPPNLDPMAKKWMSNWTGRLASAWSRLAYTAMRPCDHVESWDRWELTHDRRRELSDLEAIRVRYRDHA